MSWLVCVLNYLYLVIYYKIVCLHQPELQNIIKFDNSNLFISADGKKNWACYKIVATLKLEVMMCQYVYTVHGIVEQPHPSTNDSVDYFSGRC